MLCSVCCVVYVVQCMLRWWWVCCVVYVVQCMLCSVCCRGDGYRCSEVVDPGPDRWAGARLQLRSGIVVLKNIIYKNSKTKYEEHEGYVLVWVYPPVRTENWALKVLLWIQNKAGLFCTASWLWTWMVHVCITVPLPWSTALVMK